jgi:hypothetical protein
MKVVYNACFGGFSLSEAGIARYAEIKGITLYPERDPQYPSFGIVTYWTVPPEDRTAILEGDAWNRASMEERKASNEAYGRMSLYSRDIPRDDPALVQVVEELGEKANGQCADLRIEDVPAGTLWRIDEYDGSERVMTQSDYEWKLAV